MKTRILIIDEDQIQLARYREALAPKSAQWELLCAETAEIGIESAKGQDPDIVIVAFSVQGEHGVELLSQIESLLPNAQLFISASESDKPKLDDAFGRSFQFLPNPCPPDRLVTEIQRCVAIDTWLGNPKIKQIIAKMGEFPSLPPMYLKVVNAINSRNASANSIAEAISGDLAISAKVLQSVNSSYYGFEEKISDITQAVSILGLDCVKNLVLAIQVFGKFSRTPDQKAVTDALWHHSMSVAVAAKRVAAYEADDRAAEEAYTAGLMHDLGKLVLLNAEPEGFEKARELSRERGISLWQAEEEVIGCNHAETGAYLLGRWGMPAAVVEAVALHHEPVNSFGKSFSTLAAVHIANALVWERHPNETTDAQPDQAFLADIGKAASWSTWRDVVTGKAPAKPAKGLTLKSDTTQSPDSPAAHTDSTSETKEPASPSNGRSTRALSPAKEGQSQESSSGSLAPLGIALVACLGVAAGLYFLLKPSDETAAVPAPRDDADITFADSIQKAKELSGASRTEDALQEIFDSMEEPTQPEPPAVEIAEAAPEPTPEAADPRPENPEQSEPEPEIEVAQNEPAPHPEPDLPAAEDSFPNIQLAGIFFNPDNPLASVNGRIRRAGDMVDGAEIVRIEQRQIVVRYADEVRAIKLN